MGRTLAPRRTTLSALIGVMLAGTGAATAADWNCTAGGGFSFWSLAGNWLPMVAPGPTDPVVFANPASCRASIVDRDLTIASLSYRGNVDNWRTELAGATLAVTGPLSIGVGDPTQGARLTLAGGAVTVGTAAAPRPVAIGLNNSVAALGSTAGALTMNGTSLGGFISELSIGRKDTLTFVTSGADGSLVLGANSALSVGTTAARAANVFVGHNATNAGNAAGLLDARQGNVDIHATGFTVGGAYGGSGTGTLRWDRPSVLDATHFYLGRGIGTGVLDLAPGATFSLGSASARTSTLNIAFNDSTAGAGAAQAHLDLSLNDPSFSAYLADGLSIGRKDTLTFVTSGADGSLVLGANSTLSVGTTAARAANVFVGHNATNAGHATGVLDAGQGSVQIFAATTSVGFGAGGSGSGTFSTGAGTALDTTNLLVGTGAPSIGSFNLRDGVVTARTTTLGANGHFVFTGGRFNAISFVGALTQDGGVLAPGAGTGPSRLSISQGYSLAAPGVLEIDLAGVLAGTGYDQLVVTGGIDLARNGAGTLDLHLAFAPPTGAAYTIIDNDGTDAVLGTFAGLAEGGTLVERFGNDLYAFRISYVGGSGNDVVLNMTGVAAVPEPATAVLLALGIVAMLSWRRSGTHASRRLSP